MYKAVIIDLDGTAIPNRKDGMPSARLINVVNKIKNRVSISAATGRGVTGCRQILKSLGLISPCIVGGGTQIIDPITEKILWEKDMDEKQIEKIMEIIKKYYYPFFLDDEIEGSLPNSKLVQGNKRVIYVQPVDKDDTEIILNALNKIPNITAHKVVSWTPDKFDIHITHSEATKEYSLNILLEMLKIHKDDIVAVGDGNNDLPLFNVAGYKVAMENGSKELKNRADLITSSATNDGLAIVLEDLFEPK